MFKKASDSSIAMLLIIARSLDLKKTKERTEALIVLQKQTDLMNLDMIMKKKMMFKMMKNMKKLMKKIFLMTKTIINLC